MNTRHHNLQASSELVCTALSLLALIMLYSNSIHADSSIRTTGETSAIIDIKISDDGYALMAQQATLTEILHTLGETAGFKLLNFTNINEAKNDWQYKSMPLPRLLENLTRGYSTVTLYTEVHSNINNTNNRQAREVWLISRDSTPGVITAPGPGIEIKLDQDKAQLTGANTRTTEQQYEISSIDNLEGLTGDDVVDTLKQTLSADDDPLVRKRAVTALGEIGGSEVLDALESCMSDTSSEVRTELAKTLSDIKDQRSMLLLGQLLMGDQSSGVRQQAVHSLYQQGSPAARSFVETVAKDKDPAVKRIAHQILQQWPIAAESE